MWRRIAFLSLAILALAVGGTLLPASEGTGKKCTRLEAVAVKLGLSDKQKEEVGKMHKEFCKNAAALRQQLRTLHKEQRQTMRQLLTEEQRAMLPGLIKAERDRHWQAVAGKLGLSEEQTQRVDKARAEYAKKVHDLAANKGTATPEQFRTLRREKMEAIRGTLTEAQRTKLVVLCREEFQKSRHPAARKERWKSLGEKLGVSAEQKEQFQKVRAEYAPKMDKPSTQLKQLRQDAHAAMLKVLTEEQRARFLEMRQARVRKEATPPATPKE